MFQNPEHAFGGTTRLLALIETIYAAVHQPALWTDVMEGIAETVHGEYTTLFTELPDGHLFAMARTDPAVWEAFAAHYWSVNVIMQRGDRACRDGESRYSQQLLRRQELEATEYFNDFMRPNGMYWALGTKVTLQGSSPAALSSFRDYGKGEFAPEVEGVVYDTLMPHVERALNLHTQLSQANARALGMEAALGAMQHAVFGLDTNGKVILSNAGADHILRSERGLHLRNGRLSASLPKADKQLQALLTAALNTGHNLLPSSGGAMLLPSDRKAGLRLTVQPFSTGLASPVLPIRALVYISDPARKESSRAALMRALFELSPTESRVADLLLEGQQVNTVAASLGMSLETARFHTKRILSKTETNRQAELIKLMLSLPSSS